jgi:hypothetical protein
MFLDWTSFLKECDLNYFQNFLLQFFSCYLLYFSAFLYSLISLSLWNFKTVFLNRPLMRISFHISLLNHGLSLFRIVIIFVGIHSFAIIRKHLINFLILPNFSFKWSWDIFGTLKNYDWGIMITNFIR